MKKMKVAIDRVENEIYSTSTKLDVAVNLFNTYQWKQFVEIYIKPKREILIEKIKKCEEKDRTDLVGQLKVLDLFKNYELIKDELTFENNVASSHKI